MNKTKKENNLLNKTPRRNSVSNLLVLKSTSTTINNNNNNNNNTANINKSNIKELKSHVRNNSSTSNINIHLMNEKKLLEMGTPSGNIRVLCRVRPFNNKEKEIGTESCIDFIDKQTLHIKIKEKDKDNKENKESKINNHKFTFDRVFDPESTQLQVYEETAKPVVDSIIAGFNGTILAYGQTSSGKSFTMQGVLGNNDLKGLTPRIVEDVFSQLNNLNNVEYKVLASVLEIYQEKLRDLTNINNNNLVIRENSSGGKGVYVDDLNEVEVSNLSQVMRLIDSSMENRSVASTNMNEHSSRSHLIFYLQVIQINNDDLSRKIGKLYLVDLAGSERISKTGATGNTLDEAKGINKSLTVLGMVINALTENSNSTKPHIPYRDSKLTRLLSESLGGNSKTSLIVTLSPSPYNDSESLSSLRFGIRAKKVKNNAKINKEVSIPELKLEIDKLNLHCLNLQWKYEQLVKYISSKGVEIPNDDELNTISESNLNLYLNTNTNNLQSASSSTNKLVEVKVYNNNVENVEASHIHNDQTLNDANDINIIENYNLNEEKNSNYNSQNNFIENGASIEYVDNKTINDHNNTIREEDSCLEQTFINISSTNNLKYNNFNSFNNFKKSHSKIISGETINKPILAVDRNKSRLDETNTVSNIKEINEIEDIRVKYVELLYVINQIEEEKNALKTRLEAYSKNNKENNREDNKENNKLFNNLIVTVNYFSIINNSNVSIQNDSNMLNETNSKNNSFNNKLNNANSLSNYNENEKYKINNSNNKYISSRYPNINLPNFTPLKINKQLNYTDDNNVNNDNKENNNKSNSQNDIDNYNQEEEYYKDKDSQITVYTDMIQEILYDIDDVHHKHPDLKDITDILRVYNDKLKELKREREREINSKNEGKSSKKENSKEGYNLDILKDIEKRASKLVNIHIKSKPGVQNVIYNPNFVKWNLGNFKNKFKHVNSNQ